MFAGTVAAVVDVAFITAVRPSSPCSTPTAGARKVYACEWNSNALEALNRNLELNQVAGRCEVLPGDCCKVSPKVQLSQYSLWLFFSVLCVWCLTD